MAKVGSRAWLRRLGFVEWEKIAYVFGPGWLEYQRRPPLKEKGIYAVAVVQGFDYDRLSPARRFYPRQQAPDGAPLAEVPHETKPHMWRRRWWTIKDLDAKWVEAIDLVYLGKSDPPLKQRVGQLRRFALGGLSHSGGQILWHLRGYPDRLELGVLPVSRFPGDLASTPRDAEKQLLREFRLDHGGCLPFANIVG